MKISIIKIIGFFALALPLLFLGAVPASALTTTEVDKLIASDGTANDNLGYSVSISGEVAVLGAYRSNVGGSESGAAYIYRFDGSTWNEEAKLLASDIAPGDWFGYSVSISGSVAVVGAWRNSDAGSWSGSAYIYRYNGVNWSEDAKLTANDAAAFDEYGWTVAVSGNVVVVGAPFNDSAVSNAGKAYVYRFDGSNWNEEIQLTASDAGPSDIFGYSVGIDGNTIAIGANFDDDITNNSGATYIFRHNGISWIEESKLKASDAASLDEFGSAVSISGDVVLVGARGNDDTASNSGSAYIYRYNGSTWHEEQKLLASDAAFFDRYGHAVSISSDLALVGAYNNFGSAYIYQYDGSTWPEEAILNASDEVSGDAFSYSVSIDSNTLLIGAPFDDDKGGNSGSAYVFSLTTNQAPTADAGPDQTVECTSVSVTAVTLDGSGSTDPDGDPLTYDWSWNTSSASGVGPTISLPLGSTPISLVVNDGQADSTPDEVSVTVSVAVSGFLSPLAALAPDGGIPESPDKAFKKGRVLPLKLTLSCQGTALMGSDVTAPEIIMLARQGEPPLNLEVLDLDAGESADSGFLFRDAGDGQWIYNLKTSDLAEGTYEITIEMPDGQHYIGIFVLK